MLVEVSGTAVCGVVVDGIATSGDVASIFGVTVCDGVAGTCVASDGATAGVVIGCTVRAFTCATCADDCAFTDFCGAGALISGADVDWTACVCCGAGADRKRLV